MRCSQFVALHAAFICGSSAGNDLSERLWRSGHKISAKFGMSYAAAKCGIPARRARSAAFHANAARSFDARFTTCADNRGKIGDASRKTF
jgi:hypothetical protein